MQILIKRSTVLILAVLSCSIWIALDDGTGLTGFNSNPTEVVETPSSDDSIWRSMSNEFKLDLRTQNSQVQAQIRHLLADQDELQRILKAAAPYIYYIYSQTRAKGLPAELALIPVIESEFNPNDHSNKGATGLWQLMPETAHDLGVKVKSSYDGRKNVMASTKAALAYFKDLATSFNGNWYLAIAAYNCGPNRIVSAERKTGSSSFWGMPLPKETQYYVPKLLAVAAIIKNPKKYGVELPKIQNAPYFAEVKTQKAVELTTVAKNSNVSVETLHKLNPDYVHGSAAPVKEGYSLLVPADKVTEVKEKLADKTVIT